MLYLYKLKSYNMARRQNPSNASRVAEFLGAWLLHILRNDEHPVACIPGGWHQRGPLLHKWLHQIFLSLRLTGLYRLL